MPRFVRLDRTPIVDQSEGALYERCECGKWLNRDTREHVELEEHNFEDLVKLHKKCEGK